MQLIFIYVLLTTCYLTTIAAPALQRQRSQGGQSGGRSVLVADTDDTEAGGTAPGRTGADDECNRNTPRVIERCLNGFEVQFISYNRSRTAASRRLAMTELCRQHDHTLHCIYRAFIMCPATAVDLQIVASRIGHHRDFMRYQCNIVRKSTTASTTTLAATTTTLPPSSTTPTPSSVTTPKPPAIARTSSTPNPWDGKKLVNESNWGSLYVSRSAKTTPTSQVKQLEDEYIIEGDAGLKNRKYPVSTRDATWCQSHEGQNSLECYFQALRSSAIVARSRPLLQAAVSCLTYVLFVLC